MLRLPQFEEDASREMEIRRLRRELNALPTIARMTRFATDRKNRIRNERAQLRIAIQTLQQASAGGETTNRIPVVGFCPQQDCKGYVHADGRCGLCKNEACLSCGVPMMGATHVCEEGQKASFKAIREETKPCPKCSIPIFHDGGCHQMWCVQCHTLWEWNTNKILDKTTTTNHNPHFHQWLGSEVQLRDLALDDLPTVINYMILLNERKSRHLNFLTDMLEHVFRGRDRVLPTLNPARIRVNDDLCRRYLMGDLTREAWEFLLVFREKKRLKLEALRDFCNRVLMELSEILRLAILRTTRDETFPVPFDMAQRWRNDLQKIRGKHGHSLPYDFKDWTNYILSKCY